MMLHIKQTPPGLLLLVTRKNAIKSTAYKSFVRPQLEYASTAWSPHTRCNIDKIEAVQRWAARSVLIGAIQI